MTDKEIRRLRKKTLVEMLMNQTREKELLLAEITELKERLNDKEIRLDNAGTIAEASFEMNGVLSAAQNAAQQYLDNLKAMTERKEKVIKAECDQLIEMTKYRCEQMEKDAEEKSQSMIRMAELEIEEKWNDLSERLEEFYQSHKGLKTLLTAEARIKRV